MVIGFEEFNIDGYMLRVELVDRIPNGYMLIDKQKGYKIYRKDEQFSKDIYHYYIGIRSD